MVRTKMVSGFLRNANTKAWPFEDKVNSYTDVGWKVKEFHISRDNDYERAIGVALLTKLEVERYDEDSKG